MPLNCLKRVDQKSISKSIPKVVKHFHTMNHRSMFFCSALIVAALLQGACSPIYSDPITGLSVLMPFKPAPISAAQIPTLIKVGNTIKIETRSGLKKILKVSKVNDTSLEGVDSKGNAYLVPYKTIATILKKSRYGFRDPRMP